MGSIAVDISRENQKFGTKFAAAAKKNFRCLKKARLAQFRVLGRPHTQSLSPAISGPGFFTHAHEVVLCGLDCCCLGLRSPQIAII